MILWTVVSLMVLPLMLSEFSEVSPWLARRLLSWAAGRLADKRKAERYREEWLAGLQDVPGKLTKLVKALSIVSYWVPVMHWRANRAAYLWPTRRIFDGLWAVAARSKRQRRLEALLSRYGIWFSWQTEPGGYFTLAELRGLVWRAADQASAHLLLRRSQVVGNDLMVLRFDHKRMRVEVTLRPAVALDRPTPGGPDLAR
jgi:hypothetical protein